MYLEEVEGLTVQQIRALFPARRHHEWLVNKYNLWHAACQSYFEGGYWVRSLYDFGPIGTWMLNPAQGQYEVLVEAPLHRLRIANFAEDEMILNGKVELAKEEFFKWRKWFPVDGVKYHRNGYVVVTAGEARVMAARQLGFTSIPMMFSDTGQDGDGRGLCAWSDRRRSNAHREYADTFGWDSVFEDGYPDLGGDKDEP